MSALLSLSRRRQRARLQPLSRYTLRVGVGALLAASIACGGDSTGPEPIEGTYALQTMGARPLPVVVLQDETGKYEITAGSVILRAPNAFTMSLTFRETVSGQANTLTSEISGTWARSGASVTLTDSDGDVVSATLSGRTLRMMGEAEDLGTIEWVFSK